MIINGAPNNTASYRLEGMDNTNHTVGFAVQENQPSADAVQEIAIQTSNYAAEYRRGGRRVVQPGDEVGHQSVSRHRIRVLRE